MSTDAGALDALFKKPAFAHLGEERLLMFRKFAEDIDGKKPPEIAAKLMRLNHQLAKNPLSANEREAIADAIKESLPESDRHKFNLVLKMI